MRRDDAPVRVRGRDVRLLAVAALLSLLTPGCRREPGPAERYRAFASAARAGDSDAVWSMLSERSRAELDARAKALAARAPGGVVPSAGRDLVLGGLFARARRVGSVSLVRESGDSAVVSVELEGGGGGGEVTLVREGRSWRVVLPFDN